MDRKKTIFINIADFTDTYDIEMHTIHKICRQADIKKTLIYIEDDSVILVPMNKNEHHDFMKAVYNSQEIWFSYVGYILNLAPTEEQRKRQNYMQKKLEEATSSMNKKIVFSVVGGKTNI